MKLRIRKVIKSDWPALAFVIGSITLVILHVVFSHQHKNLDNMGVFWFSLCGFSLVIIGFMWRVLRLKRIAAVGHVTDGTVDRIYYSKDRGRVEYSFIIAGKLFNSWHPVHLSSEVKALHERQKVHIVFNPKNPNQSFVAELFLEYP